MMSAILENLGRQPPLFQAMLIALPLAAACYGLVALNKASGAVRTLGSALMWATLVASTVLIAMRWVEADRPPFKSLYESLVLFVWCTALLYVAVERFYRIAWFGFMTAGFLWIVLGYALFKTDAEVVNLPAALQSVWFVPHVVVYFFAYAAIFFGFAGAVLHLWRPDAVVHIERSEGGVMETSYAGFMHLAILFGFVLLTAGLIMGALWAKVAWGDYWVWDPKENWALVSWLVYVIYLHLRYTRGFDDRQAAIIAVLGFGAIVFTYLGMHLLPTADTSAHIYQG